jgi:hypothetical protein
MTFPGIVQQGKLKLDRLSDFTSLIHSLEGKRVEVSLEKQRRKRSNNQNAYYWLILEMISKETGQDALDLHQAFKMKFSKHITLRGLVIPQSTKTKDTGEFTEYLEQVRQWAGEFLNMTIPDPQQYQLTG